ncbi:unnamed protein product [Timema podura]|uniref:Uncharacterized protein n=1 Tax=Timema podura TaxID=61482 RepID=A0ABN7P3Y1_TIMPD|nr:unnamed protein product [Timema podura]
MYIEYASTYGFIITQMDFPFLHLSSPKRRCSKTTVQAKRRSQNSWKHLDVRASSRILKKTTQKLKCSTAPDLKNSSKVKKSDISSKHSTCPKTTQVAKGKENRNISLKCTSSKIGNTPTNDSDVTQQNKGTNRCDKINKIKSNPNINKAATTSLNSPEFNALSLPVVLPAAKHKYVESWLHANDFNDSASDIEPKERKPPPSASKSDSQNYTSLDSQDEKDNSDLASTKQILDELYGREWHGLDVFSNKSKTDKIKRTRSRLLGEHCKTDQQLECWLDVISLHSELGMHSALCQAYYTQHGFMPWPCMAQSHESIQLLGVMELYTRHGHNYFPYMTVVALTAPHWFSPVLWSCLVTIGHAILKDVKDKNIPKPFTPALATPDFINDNSLDTSLTLYLNNQSKAVKAETERALRYREP